MNRGWVVSKSTAAITAITLGVAAITVAAPPSRTAANQTPTQQAPSLVFERNDGQTDAAVRYVARARGYQLYLTSDEAVLSLAHTASTRVALRMTFAGGASRVEGFDPLPGRAHYFVGSPDAWLTNVETFARVRYESNYPGVDAIFYGRDGELEYDFVVAPHADARQIAFELSGAERVAIDDAGDLVVETAAGVVRQRRPVAYQERDGARVPVPSRFALDGARVRVETGAYDRSLPLVVDPVLAYSTYLGATGDESGAGVAVDAAGNAIVVGGTTSLDYPTTAGVFQPTSAGLSDAFVTKLSADGTGYVFSTYLGGGGDEGIARAALDGSGNVYLAGGTSSTNWPTTAGAFDTTFNGGSFDAFAAKLSSNGSSLLFSTYVGGGGDDGFAAVAIDASANVYLAGAATSSNFPTSATAFDRDNTSLLSFPDAVVTKLSADGATLVYSTYLGGGFNLEGGAAIAVDASGNAIVGGATNGGFPTTSGAFDTSYNGGPFDGFVTKVNATGSGLVFSTYAGGGGEEYVFGLAADASGNAYLTGYTASTNFPTASAFQPTNAGGFDAFVTKLAASGASLVYSSYLGGSGAEGVTSNLGTELEPSGAIAVDAAGSAYLTGFTDSTDFPVVAAWQKKNGGGIDAWAAKISPSGTTKEYASYLGGAGEERGLGIAADAAGNAYVTGFTLSPVFSTTAGVVNPSGAQNGLSDGFVTKIGMAPGDGPGVYILATGAWFLRTTNAPGPASAVFTYGAGGAGIVPLAGDWDGNSTATAGLYDQSTGAFFLRNRNSPGPADVLFTFGGGGANILPLVGDWDGDGTETIGLYATDTGFFFLRNANASGGADLTFGFGAGGANIVPLAGDWNGDGVDTIGLYDRTSGFFFLRNSSSPGGADVVFGFGPAGPGIEPLVGDWNADGTDTIGVYVASTGAWFLRNTNTPGGADVVFSYGPAGATPLTGHWGG
jgi:hypothetical protein